MAPRFVSRCSSKHLPLHLQGQAVKRRRHKLRKKALWRFQHQELLSQRQTRCHIQKTRNLLIMRLISLTDSKQDPGYPSHPKTRGLTLFTQQWTDTPPDTNTHHKYLALISSSTHVPWCISKKGAVAFPPTHSTPVQTTNYEGLTVVLLKNTDLCVTMIYVEKWQTCCSPTEPSSSRSPLPLHWHTTLTGHPLPTTNHHHNTHSFPIQLFSMECLNLKVLQSFKLLPTTSSMTHCHTVKTGIIIHTSHSNINSMTAWRVIYLLNRYKMGKA
jgi:hypothetical protein